MQVNLVLGINFKKIVLRKDFLLIKSIAESTDPNANIYTHSGVLLLGEGGGGHRYNIELNGEVLGWVTGTEQSAAVATLLTSLCHKESEKRALSTELLGKYKEISLLFDLSEKILGCLSVREAAHVALSEAKQLLGADAGAVFLRQDRRNGLDRMAVFGHNDLFVDAVLVGEGVIGTLVQSGRGEIINDLHHDPRYQLLSRRADENDLVLATPETQSQYQPSYELNASRQPDVDLICVPIKTKELILGAIALTRSTGKSYKAEDLKLTTTLVGQAAGVINALLHEDKLKESRQNDLILRLSSQIHESLELDEILKTTVTEIYTALHLDRCVFLWCEVDADTSEESGIEITTECKRSDLMTIRGHYSADTVKRLAQRLSHCQPLRIDDVAIIGDDQTRQFLESHRFKNFLAMPIQTRSGQIGVICCGTSQDARAWLDGEVSLLKAVSNQLAIALDQAELYDQSRAAAQAAQDKAKQLETTVGELQQAQLQLVQSEKMSSIGQMVAGVAHEINNPVGFISGNLRHLQAYSEDLMMLIQHYQDEYPSPSETLQADIEDVDLAFLLEDLPKTLTSMAVGTERIREIVLSLRNFSRLDQADFKSADIHEGIDSTLLILRHRLKASDTFPGVEIVKDFSDLPPVDCYPGQLNQVFMNILANGIDALEEAAIQEPKITISTLQLSSGCIQICISDNGPGISANIKEKLFDPFFTTKEVGKGTGLGLSISYQIITERHGGRLRCELAQGHGTQFLIEIPIQQRPVKR